MICIVSMIDLFVYLILSMYRRMGQISMEGEVKGIQVSVVDSQLKWLKRARGHPTAKMDELLTDMLCLDDQ